LFGKPVNIVAADNGTAISSAIEADITAKRLLRSSRSASA
jgi:hypothetical protein